MIKKLITGRLSAALQPSLIKVEDVSEAHRGHGGWREGVETHFDLLIVSERFTGLNPVARHRLVLAELGDLMDNPVHALSMTTKTAEEYRVASASLP